MDKFIDEIFVRLRELGCHASIVSIDHLPSLRKEIEEFRDQGLFDGEFYKEHLAHFRFQISESLPKAKSIIVVAVPRPQTQAILTWKGHPRPLIIPPTYTEYDDTRERLESFLAKALSEKGYKWAKTDLPLKLLAVRSGLGQYGRNNICYVSAMGSFLQLVAVYSDVPCEEDCWQEATMMMKGCEGCELCRRACPTGAIPSDRFLLRAERCIVYHNEKNGAVPFPSWMDSSWHNCIVGCMHCQRVCPQNEEFIGWVGKEEEFSEEETTLILEGTQRDRLKGETLKKLENLSLVDYLDSLPRNLRGFFRKSE